MHTGDKLKENLNKRVEKHIKCRCFRAPGLTEWFECENDGSKMLQPLQLPDHNTVEQQWNFGPETKTMCSTTITIT